MYVIVGPTAARLAVPSEDWFIRFEKLEAGIRSLSARPFGNSLQDITGRYTHFYWVGHGLIGSRYHYKRRSRIHDTDY